MAQILGKPVGLNGFGLMSLTWRDTPMPHEQAIPVMKTALEMGANFWNGGDFYGPPEHNSLHLVKAYFTKYPEDAPKVILSIKSGTKITPKGPVLAPQWGKEARIRECVDNALKILDGTKTLDIFENARVDPDTPVEETVAVLEKLRQEGRIGGIGLSEVGAATIRRAAKVAPIAAVENELSLFATHTMENGAMAACKELNIAYIAYSPLGRGFLTGKFRKLEDVPLDSPLRHYPRFQPGVFEHNVQLSDTMDRIAKNKGCAPSQLAMAWVRSLNGKWGTVIALPGSSQKKHVEEFLTNVELTAAEHEEIDAILAKFEVQGDRYPTSINGLCDV